jgi:hypothetical protein
VADGEGFAADEQLVDARKRLRRLVNHAIEQRGGEPHDADVVRLYFSRKVSGRGDALREKYAARAVQQRAPQLKSRGVE